MRSTLWLVVLVWLLSACKKEFKQPDLVGTWEFNSMVKEPTSGPIKIFAANSEVPSETLDQFGNVQLEITSDSRFIFSSKKGKQKFRVIRAEEFQSEIHVHTNTTTIENSSYVSGYKYQLRATNGDGFTFHFYYDSYTNRIVTVPWVRGVAYNSWDRPYRLDPSRFILGVHYQRDSFNLNPTAIHNQILADFNRIN